MTLMIRSEIHSQLTDMPEAERPININNPGDDPNFHALVNRIKQEMEVHLVNKVDHYLSEGLWALFFPPHYFLQCRIYLISTPRNLLIQVPDFCMQLGSEKHWRS